MKKGFLFYCLSLCLITFSGCSDNDNDDKDAIDSFLIGEWVYNSQTLNGNDLPFNEDCRGGNDGIDYEIFNANDTYQRMDFDKNGENECTFEEDESFSGTWSYTSDDSIINLIINDQVVDGELQPGTSLVLNILKVNENELSYMVNIDYDQDGIIDELILNLIRKP